MTTANQPNGEPQGPPDPAQLGADQSPATTSRDDAHDMSPILANETRDQDTSPDAHPTQGSDFDHQRQQDATSEGHYGDVGRSMGMGRTGDNGDEDRGYDESGYRGGLGSSGGREDLSDRQTDTDQNPFTGGYDGQGDHRPPASQSQHLGLNTPSPTGDKPAQE